ncbi:MAG: carbohydrate ABC transporter permease [Methylobacteriaceae bacterium]|nr:carbohydrate ABC transporter permease [Methylobacteriaceae bacterium]
MRAGARSAEWTRVGAGSLAVAVMLFPIYWMINASLQPRVAMLQTFPAFIPNPPILDAYRNIIDAQGPHVLVSCVVAGLSAIVSLTVAAPCAYAIVTFRMRWTTGFVLLLLLVQMMPNIVTPNALYAIFARLQLLNTYAALVLCDSTLSVPFAILLLRAFMVSLPKTFTEAAMVDGAGYWGAFVRVILPLSRNGLITAGLFCFLFAWSDFLFALTMSTKQRIVPITLGIYQFIGTHNTDWPSVMATAVLASVPPIVLLLFGQKYITAGLTGGALKD